MKRSSFGILAAAALVSALILASLAVAQRSGRTSPKRQLSGSTTLTLSQVYGGGGGASGTYMNDYVEIKNISNTAQSLNGLSLYYGSATGQFASSATNAFALPNVSLNPGQYFLVQTSAAGSGGTALPVTPDATTTNLSMSGTNGKVALVIAANLAPNTCGGSATPCTLPNAAIIDLVAWGTANNAEGGAATNGGVSLTSTQGNVRKGAGCTDTDNNDADFDVVTAPVPRNSASTATSCSAAPVNTQHVVDFNGDGKTDYAIARASSPTQIDWFMYDGIGTYPNGYSAVSFGAPATDYITPEDFDGDGKTDVAVWREAPAGSAGFYILQSADSTVRFDNFGQTGDDPAVVGDYDGDGKADPAVFRCPDIAAPADQCHFFYRGSLTPTVINYVPWGYGNSGDFFPYVGDFDGDGKNDFCLQRSIPGNPTQGQFVLLRSSDLAVQYVSFGLSSDFLIPGDYDGDGKTDYCVRRSNTPSTGLRSYYVLTQTGAFSAIQWGITNDVSVPGDYDGDGKTDFAVWRPSTNPDQNYFYVLNSSSLSVSSLEFGQCPTGNCDFAVASWPVH